MTAKEVFTQISARLVEGMMLHERMADAYDFIGMNGFKRLHEYHFLCDAVNLRGVHRYYINHFNTVLPDSTGITAAWDIPSSWYDHVRSDVGTDTKKNTVKTCVDRIAQWNHETKKLFEDSYKSLCDIGEIAAACKAKELISEIDMTAKYADRLCVTLKGVDYDLPTIYLMQDEIHAEYDEKARSMGVCIC